jgi:hypothetical protein
MLIRQRNSSTILSISVRHAFTPIYIAHCSANHGVVRCIAIYLEIWLCTSTVQVQETNSISLHL